MKNFPDPSTAAPTSPLPASVCLRAAQWLVALQAHTVDGVARDDTRQRWQAWRAAHPDHERAWQRIEAFSGRVQSIPSPLAHAALSQTDLPDAGKRRKAIKALAVLLFAGGAAWYGQENTPWQQWAADASTGRGERRSLVLADGTRVDLGASTQIDIRYSPTQRVLRLMGGEILVATAHDPAAVNGVPARPFIVETTHGRIRALGTRFTVRQIDSASAQTMQSGFSAHASKVSVIEGAVEIRARHGMPDSAQAGRILSAGQQARFSRDAVTLAEPADAAGWAWTQGMLVAQDMPLADFVAELARYTAGSAGNLRCDPAVAHLKVSGTYPLANPGKTLDMLQTALPVRARQQRRWWGGAEMVLVAR